MCVMTFHRCITASRRDSPGFCLRLEFRKVNSSCCLFVFARHSLQSSRNFLLSSRLCVGGTSPFRCVGIENRTVFREVGCNLLSEKATKILPKLFSSKGINHGIDAAVDHWNCFRHLGCFVQLATDFTTIDGKWILEVTQENTNVIRCPEKKVYNHDDKNKPDCFVFLLIPTL